jgi:hypothetical protein
MMLSTSRSPMLPRRGPSLAQDGRGTGPEGYATPVEGEDFYTVEEAAA